jgi:excisionase family DNA binding protein
MPIDSKIPDDKVRNRASALRLSGEETALRRNQPSTELQRFDSDAFSEPNPPTVTHADDCPLTVREAAKFLGVSPQTVYLWVERKQIPHLRVMGRNIRFLKSDLEPFRASFKQEMENE